MLVAWISFNEALLLQDSINNDSLWLFANLSQDPVLHDVKPKVSCATCPLRLQSILENLNLTNLVGLILPFKTAHLDCFAANKPKIS